MEAALDPPKIFPKKNFEMNSQISTLAVERSNTVVVREADWCGDPAGTQSAQKTTADLRAGANATIEATASETLKQEKALLEARLTTLQQQLDNLMLMQQSQTREQLQLEQLQQAAQLIQQGASD